MKKRLFRFITYVTVFLCLYNNAVSAADSLQPSSIFDGESRDEEVLKEIRREYERRTGVSSSAGEVQLSILYSMASREVREGILEKGVLIYEYILKLFPGEKDARIELASIWFGLGQFEKALSYIDGIGYKEGEKDYDADKAVRLGRFKEHILKALDTLEKKRELERKGYRTVVVPDGKGGYILDTIGFRGKWIFRDRANGGSIHPGYVLRLIKSLAFVIEQRSQLLGNIDNTVNEVILISGTDKKVVFQKKRNADGYRVFVSKEILNDSPQEQRALFSGLFNKRECHIVDTDTGVVDINIPVLSKDKRIISIALNKSLEEGRNLLSDLLTKEGFRIERENMGNDEDWGLMRLNSGDSEFSDIMERFRERAAPLAERIASNNFQAVCISIDSQSIEKAYMLIEEIRKRRPDIFIIIGGPLSSLPEQMISLLPGADAVIAGEADISLPRLFNLLSRDGREISPQDLVSATNGGFYLKSGNNIFIDNLYKTDKPEDIHMAVPYDDKRSETIFTSRGCPYSCTFCNLILGKKFRAVPVDEVIDWLIHKLALKMSAERKEEMAYDAVKKLLESGENLYSHGLRSPIMIDIWDDNFFINRNRVIALFNRIIEKGLNRYFTFVVEGVSLRAIQRNGRIDREILDLALRAGVTILKFGIDGFSRRNLIDFNKGYSQEDIVKAIFELHDIGFLVGTNIIDSSPRTFYSDMLEGLILFGILPAYYKVYDNPGVLGDLTNELTVYESLSRAGEMRWEKRHKIFGYHDEGSYMVPEAEEYAYRRYNLLRIYDEDTQQAARRMFSKDFNFIQHLTSEECKEAFPLVLKRWVSGECGPELKALGEIFIKLLDKYNGDIYKARARIIEDIRSLYCTGFVNLRELYERYGYGEDLDIKTVYRIDELDNLLNNAIRAREFGKAVRLADIASKISGDNLKYLYLGAAIDYIRYFYGDLGITLGDIIKNSGINIPLFYKDHMDRLSHRVTDYLVKRINGMHLGFPDEASGMTSPDVWKGFTENMSIIADNIIEALRFINGETQIPVYKPLKVKVVNKKQALALEEYAKASFKELMQEPLEEEGAASDFTRMLSYESGMRRLAGLDDIGDQLGELYGRTEEKGKLTDILLDSLIRDMEFKHDNFTPFNERRVYKNHFNYCTVLQPEQEDILIGTLGYDYYDEDKGDFVIFFKGEKEEETEDGGKERKVYIGMMSLDEYLNFNVNHLKGFIPGTLKAGVVYSKEGTDEILRVKELLGYENIDFIDFHIDSPWLNIAVTEDGFCIMDRREDSIIVNRTWHELETDLFIKEKVVVSQGGSSTDIITVWDGKSDLTQLLKDADIVILGAPDSTGTKRNLGLGGSEKAPDSVIDELLKRDLTGLKGLKVVYLGNIKIPETDRVTRVTRKDGQTATFPDALLETYADIKSVVSGVLKINPNICLVQVGGDHGNAYPFNAPFSDGRGRLGFINVDAHFDTRDPKDPTRPEGPNSGTPFRYLLEESHTPPENAVFLGIDPENPYAASLEEYVRSVGVDKIITYPEVVRRWREERDNFGAFIDDLLGKVVSGVDTGHISFCIDVVNEDEAPGCSARNKNGLTSEIVRFIARRAGMNERMRSIGLFEIIPELDNQDKRTVRLGVDILVGYFEEVLERNYDEAFNRMMIGIYEIRKAEPDITGERLKEELRSRCGDIPEEIYNELSGSTGFYNITEDENGNLIIPFEGREDDRIVRIGTRDTIGEGKELGPDTWYRGRFREGDYIIQIFDTKVFSIEKHKELAGGAKKVIRRSRNDRVGEFSLGINDETGEYSFIFGLDIPVERQIEELRLIAGSGDPDTLDVLYDMLRFMVKESHGWPKERPEVVSLFLNIGKELVLAIDKMLENNKKPRWRFFDLLYSLWRISNYPPSLRNMAKDVMKNICRGSFDDLLERIRPKGRYSSEEDVRRYATYLHFLSEIPDKRAIPVLIEILRAEIPYVEESHIYITGPLAHRNMKNWGCSGIPMYKAAWMDIKGDALYILADLAKSLGKAERERIIEEMLGLFNRTLEKAKGDIAYLLLFPYLVGVSYVLAEPRAVSLIIEALELEIAIREEPEVTLGYPGHYAVYALAEIGEGLPDGEERARIVSRLMGLFKDPRLEKDYSVRRGCLLGLGTMKAVEARQMLEELAISPDTNPYFRKDAIVSLGDIANHNSIYVLVDLLDKAEELDEVDLNLRQIILDALGPLAKKIDMLRRHGPEEVKGYLTEFSFPSTGWDEFEMLFYLYEIWENRDRVSPILFAKRFPELREILGDKCLVLIMPHFMEIFGLRENRKPCMVTSSYNRFKNRLRMAKAKDAPFNIDSMVKVLDEDQENQMLMRSVFGQLLLRGNIKSKVWENNREYFARLGERGINHQRLFNLNDPDKVRGLLERVNEKDRIRLGIRLLEVTGYSLREFLDNGELLEIYADEVSEVLGKAGYGENLYFVKGVGIEFAFAGRTREDLLLGKKCGECTSPEGHAFWSCASYLSHPGYHTLLVFYNGELVDKLDLVVYEDEDTGELIMVIDAHEPIPQLEEGVSARSGLIAIREGLVQRGIEKAVEIAEEAGFKRIYGVGISNRRFLEDYYDTRFVRQSGLMQIKFLDGLDPLDRFIKANGSVFGREPSIFLQATSKGSFPREAETALTDIEGIISRSNLGYFARHALIWENPHEIARTIMKDPDYKELREMLKGPIQILNTYGIPFEYAMEIVYGASPIKAPARLFIIKEPDDVPRGSGNNLKKIWLYDRAQRILDEMRRAETEARRIDLFLERLAPLILYSEPDEGLNRILIDAASMIDEYLARLFNMLIVSPTLLPALTVGINEILIRKGYYFDIADRRIGKITRVITLKGKDKNVRILRSRPFGKGGSFFSITIGFPVVQNIYEMDDKKRRIEFRRAVIEEVQHYFDRNTGFPLWIKEAKAALANLAVGPEPVECLIYLMRSVIQKVNTSMHDHYKEPIVFDDEHDRAYFWIALLFFLDSEFFEAYEIKPGERSDWWQGEPLAKVSLSPKEFEERFHKVFRLKEEGRLTDSKVREFARRVFKEQFGEEIEPEWFSEISNEPFSAKVLGLEKEMIEQFLSTMKSKARRCKDIDEELVLAVDTDIGNLREYAGELMAELAKLNIDNVRIFIGPGASLKGQLQGYLGDGKDCVISAVLKNTNCSLFDDIGDRIRITAVEDSDFQANYIPIIPIIELAIRQAMGEDVTGDYRWLTNVVDIREADGMLIIYLLPKSKPMSVDDLRERYRNEAVVLSSA